MCEHVILNRYPSYKKPISDQLHEEDNDYPSGHIGKATYEFDLYTHNLSILTHGMPFGTQTTSVVSGKKLSQQIQEVIDKEGFNVNRIVLASCYGAVGGDFSQGQIIADQLNIPVSAYIKKYSTIDGNPQGNNGGKIKTYKPKKNKFARLINSTGNGIAAMGAHLVYNAVRLMKRGNE